MATVRALRPAPGRLRSRHLADVARHLAHDAARIVRFSIGIVNAAFIGIFSAAQHGGHAWYGSAEAAADALLASEHRGGMPAGLS